MEADPKSSSLAELLQQSSALPTTPWPVERLAFHLGALSRGDTASLAQVVELLGDGLSAPLLYHAAPEAVVSCLGASMRALPGKERFALLRASLFMRPLRDEDVAKIAALSLDGMGFDKDKDALPEPPEDLDAKLVLYRWSRLLVRTSAHVAAALESVLAERGLPSTGGTNFDTFQEWLAIRAVFIVTPQHSPAALHALREAQREDWLDQPWLLGTPDATFTLDEIEEDSSEANMQDGERVTSWLREQVLPHGDFFVASFGWLPRTSEATAREAATSRGVAILEPSAHDVAPRSVTFEEMTTASRIAWGRAVQALAEVRDGELATDVTLGFFHGKTGQEGAFEIGISNTLKNDGAKNSIRLYFDQNPAPIVEALRKTGKNLDPLGLPRSLAEVFPYCARVVIETPGHLHFDLTPEVLATWRYASPNRTVEAARPLADQTSETLRAPSAFVGHLAVEDEELEPFRVALETIDANSGVALAELVLQGTTYAMEVRSEGDRVTFRQREAHGPLTFEGAWDVERTAVKGLWRVGHQGGTFTLTPEESIDDSISAEELYESARKGSLDRSSLALEALRFPGELEHLRALFEDAHFRSAYQRSIRDRAMRTQSRNLEAQVGVNATAACEFLAPACEIYRGCEPEARPRHASAAQSYASALEAAGRVPEARAAYLAALDLFREGVPERLAIEQRLMDLARS